MLNTQVLTTKEAAEYLKINDQVFEKYLRQGKIPARKVGRQWRISKLALDLWLAPSLVKILPRQMLWNEIFSIGDKIGETVKLSEKEVLAEIKNIRKKSGISLKSRS